jgi:DNA-binding beta-propeller fold protein YncE
MTDSKECKIIDSFVNLEMLDDFIQTPCGKFLIGVEGHSIVSYCLKTKRKFRIAGSVGEEGHQDGTRDESRFNSPTSLTLSKCGKTLFIADLCNRLIRAICVGTRITKTFAGHVHSRKSIDGPKEKACFHFPKYLKLSPDGNTLYVIAISQIRTICIETGQVNTINTFEKNIQDFIFSPDGKHIYICHRTQVLKYNLETGKSKIVLKGFSFTACDISNNGQLLFILNDKETCIQIVNIVTKQVINTIIMNFEPFHMIISTNGKQLYVGDYFDQSIQVLDISKYCTNFKTFLQLQLAKHSFLSRAVVKRISI